MNNRINIIKHIEAQESKNIFQDFETIIIMMGDKKYSNSPEYVLIKTYNYEPKIYEFVWIDTLRGSMIKNKSQIANRIQYIKQSGYKFKEYQVDGDTLTIIME